MARKKRSISWKKAMGWIGGATAILTFLFGVQQLVGRIGGWREQKHRTAELVAVAREQRDAHHYAESWASLEEAAKLAGPDDKQVQTAREDLAMQWLRDARVREGEQTFTDLVKPLLPVLERGAVRASGTRKADLIAHAGWADFLRWRDGARELAPETQYKRALDIDAANPFAHAMWGHWILFRQRDLQSARAHFDAALRSGREKSYVRTLEIAALTNLNSEESNDELLRVANDMRKGNEPIEDATRHEIFWQTCMIDVKYPVGWVRSAVRLPPDEEITTLRWLFAGESDEDKRDMLRFCEARAHAWAGDSAQARNMLHALATSAAGNATRSYAQQALERLNNGGRTP